jgi:hypothetical protein
MADYELHDQVSKRFLERANKKLDELKQQGFDPAAVEGVRETMPDLAQHISAYQPSSHIPSYVEDAINKVLGVPQPAKLEIHTGQKTETQIIADSLLERQQIVRRAEALTDRVGKEKLTRIANSLFNDGFTSVELQALAALDAKQESLQVLQRIFDSAGIINPTADDIEAAAAVARAALQHIMAHHTGQYKPNAVKTPFMAWQVRDQIATGLLRSDIVEVNRKGPDTTRQIEEFDANFTSAELVLWNVDIWAAAINGGDSFIGTPVTKDLINACIPMFWQFEHPILLADEYVNYHGNKYDCVGFAVLPTMQHYVKSSVASKAELAQLEKDGKIQITTTADGDRVVRHLTGGVPQNIKDEIKENINAGISFAQRGISVAIIYMPQGDTSDPPEIRFIPSICEGEIIPTGMIAPILAALKFLTLKYVAKDAVPVSNKELKQDRALFKKVRHGKTQVPPIKVINLRRAEVRHVKETANGNQDKRHLNCHFIRDAHWRRQWYASQQCHKPIRIMAMLVGDPSKPFKAPRQKIFKAIR